VIFASFSHYLNVSVQLNDTCITFVWYSFFSHVIYATVIFAFLPSVLWHCWLGGRKGIRPVKKLSCGVLTCYLSGSRCRFHCHSLSLASVKSRLVLTFWYRLIPGWSRTKGRYTGVCVCVIYATALCPSVHLSVCDKSVYYHNGLTDWAVMSTDASFNLSYTVF